MDNLSQMLIPVLQYLLPGFVMAWIFYGLTSYPKSSQFERIIQALIFTLFIQVFVRCIEWVCIFFGEFYSFGVWSSSAELIASLLGAIILGLGFSFFANNDRFHAYLRGKKITRESSFPSEWVGELCQNVTFIAIQFKDNQRVYGWPKEWPSDPSKGHFVIADPSWVDNDGKETRITGVTAIMIDVNDIKWLEFYRRNTGEI